jgi:hypothetical protein
MNRRDLVAEGFRYLAQVLPALVVTAGNLEMFIRQPIGAASFPAQTEEQVPLQTTTASLEEE